MPVILFPYRDDLPILFEKEKQRILHAVPFIKNIHHVGSSAVPGLSGKNIVDILIGLDNFADWKRLKPELEKLGYINKFTVQEKQWAYFSSKLHGATQGDFHIHVLVKDSEDYRNWLIFRDYLRIHKEERDQYAKLGYSYPVVTSLSVFRRNESTDLK